MTLRWLHAALPLLGMAASCLFAWDDLDPRGGGGGGVGGIGGDGAGAATTASVGGGGTGGTGGTASGSTGGATGTGGMGGTPAPVLVDRGLLTRYYLDEADAGVSPSQAMDAAPQPLALDLDYGELGAAGGPPMGDNMEYATVDGQRGLAWMQKNEPGGASHSVNNTKLLALDMLTVGTIEVVADVQDAGGGAVCSRLSHLGVNNNGSFTLCAQHTSEISFRLNTATPESWTLPLAMLGRSVFHLVLDTMQATASDRVRLFVDGVDQGPGAMEAPPMQAEPIALSNGGYVLGNRIGKDGSTVGNLFYAALYQVALSDAEVANNAGVLMASDDSP
jgi:hypothetical protein